MLCNSGKESTRATVKGKSWDCGDDVKFILLSLRWETFYRRSRRNQKYFCWSRTVSTLGHTELRMENLVSWANSQLTNFYIIMINAWLWLYCQPHSSILASSLCIKVSVIAATKSDMLAEVTKLKMENKEGMERQDDLMTSAKVLQRRITRQSKVMKCDFICFANIPGPQRQSKASILQFLHFQNKKNYF